MPRRHPSRPVARSWLALGSSIRPCCPFCGNQIAPSRITDPRCWSMVPPHLRAQWQEARGDLERVRQVREVVAEYARSASAAQVTEGQR